MVQVCHYCIEKTTILQMVQVCHLLYREDYNTPDGTGMSLLYRERLQYSRWYRYVIYCIEKATILQMVQVCHLLYREDYNTPDGTGMSFTV